jgi:predicted metalloprotease with PDZ domain
MVGLLTLSGLALMGLGRDAAGAESRETGERVARSGPAEPAMPDGVVGLSLHVGAERVGDPASLYIGHVFPRGPAHEAGLEHGEEVTAIDGQPVVGKTHAQVVMMVRGEVGKPVRLSVKGERGTREVTLTRVGSDKLYKGMAGSQGGPER